MIYNYKIVKLNRDWAHLNVETFDKPVLILNDLADTSPYLQRAFRKLVCAQILNRKHINLHPVGDESLPHVEMNILLWHYSCWSNDGALSVDRLREALEFAEKNL